MPKDDSYPPDNKVLLWYEWTVDTMDGEDIEDVDHYDKLSEIPEDVWRTIDGVSMQLELSRAHGCESEGMMDRAYAQTQMVDGKLVLDTKFEDGYTVPKKFHEEIARRQK